MHETNTNVPLSLLCSLCALGGACPEVETAGQCPGPGRLMIICAPHTDLSSSRIFYVRTEIAVYAANDLHSALVEWKHRSTTNFVQDAEDSSKVVEVSSFGNEGLQRYFSRGA